ncbi:hypothetical protein ACFE04_008033 [Oxalis oulophora]
MGTLLLDQIKKNASSYLQEKYKVARLVFTDVTPAELLVEEATNNDPRGPDARTMTQLAEASYDVDDYWRIVEVLHRRLDCIDWKLWRQSYKSLVLLEFLLTHGPSDLAEEFVCDYDIIQELGTFKYTEKGFNWGANMEKRSDRLMDLLGNPEALVEARSKALKITKEIQGFGSSSPSSSSNASSSPTSDASHSSWGSYSTSSSTCNNDVSELSKNIQMDDDVGKKGTHVWDFPESGESGSLLIDDEDEKNGNQTLISELCSKLVGISINSNKVKVPIRSFSDVGRVTRKRLDRQNTAPNPRK